MALLKPPDPRIPTRKFYVRVAEPLAAMLDRYAEFLGTNGVEHVVNQALEFVFRKDSDFKEWLTRHPEPAARSQSARRQSRKTSLASVSVQAVSDASGIDGTKTD